MYMELSKLRNKLYVYNEAYRRGEPVISDNEYDELVEKLRKASPNDEFFVSGIVEKADERMEPLPVPMFSLEKIKTGRKLLAWLQSMQKAGCKYVVITPKYDGVSLLTDDVNHRAWTRGDGVEGQNCDRHFSMMDSDWGSGVFHHVWGEAIIPKRKFAKLQEKGTGYKNARNMVAGILNSPKGFSNTNIDAVKFVRYGADADGSKSEIIRRMQSEFKDSATPYRRVLVNLLLNLGASGLEGYLDNVHHEMGQEFTIDGVVLEADEQDVRKELGRLPNGNPRYAVAFKRPEWCDIYTTKVVRVTGNISKDGIYSPVIEIEPVVMNGVTVSCCTGYNARYIANNGVCPGALIEICRSGDVIPKHVSTLSWPVPSYTQQMNDMQICPSCGRVMQWDDNSVNLVCHNPECRQRAVSGMVYFFKTLGVEGFGEPTVGTLYDNGYITLMDVLGATIPALQEIFGKVRGMNVFSAISASIQKEQPLSRIMTALNVFGGKIAESIAHKILCETGDPRIYAASRTYEQAVEELLGIDGIGEAFVNAFLTGCERYDDFMRSNLEFPYTVTIDAKEEVVKAENQMVVCMTGFRDGSMEASLLKQGHRVVPSVTKDCTVLVVASMSSTSSKMEKAKRMGIRIVTRADFAKEIEM